MKALARRGLDGARRRKAEDQDERGGDERRL